MQVSDLFAHYRIQQVVTDKLAKFLHQTSPNYGVCVWGYDTPVERSYLT